jgi:hypothetical protein
MTKMSEAKTYSLQNKNRGCSRGDAECASKVWRVSGILEPLKPWTIIYYHIYMIYGLNEKR